MIKEEKLTRYGIVFDQKPDAIPYNYRTSYRVSLICLIIRSCCGRKGCSLIKLHMISVAISDTQIREELFKFIYSNLKRDLLVRFDPVVNRALTYAYAEKLIEQQANGLFKLTEKGKKLANDIRADMELLLNEKDVLDNISEKLTEEKIVELSNGWRTDNVEIK